MIAGVPSPSELPGSIISLADGRRVQPVWKNELGGITASVGQSPDELFVKWNPVGNGIDLASEIDRLRWARQFVTVPNVVQQGRDESGTWFITEAISATNAVTAQWRRRPEVAVRAIGEGLRHLHDRLPVAECPYSWSVSTRLAKATQREAADRSRSSRLQPDEDQGSSSGSQRRLADPPPRDRLVVCHGDACAPNTLLTEGGRVAGHVDFGALGTADRWADLAVATWSTNWNYGAGWEDLLLEAYGISPDAERTHYYRALWDST